MAKIQIHCSCGVIQEVPQYRFKNRKNKELCNQCVKKNNIELQRNLKTIDPDAYERRRKSQALGGKNRAKNLTAEQKSEHGKKMRKNVTISGKEMRRRQQEYINNAGTEYYEQYCKSRSRGGLAFHSSMTDQQREKHYRKVFKNRGRSKASDDCLSIISNELVLKLEYEKVINGFIVDAIINDTKTIIEFYGDVFHCNPKKFNDPNKYCSWISRTVQEQWDRDRKRLGVLYKNGYTVIIIWESDWKNDKSQVLERIRNEVRNS